MGVLNAHANSVAQVPPNNNEGVAVKASDARTIKWRQQLAVVRPFAGTRPAAKVGSV